jgi:hypothetical protein
MRGSADHTTHTTSLRTVATRALRRRLLVASLLVAALVGAGCSGDDAGDDQADAGVELDGTIELALDDAGRCEHFDAGGCMLPFPSDHFTVADDQSPTGRRLAIDTESMPANAEGVRVDPAEWNRNDGFSSGGPILVVLPGLDPERSGVAPITDIGASLEEDAPIVVLDTDTGERVPYFAELDAGPTGDTPEERTAAPEVADDETALIIRPARSLTHGHRHVVALRGLVDSEGSPIEASDGFRAYRDRLDSGVDEVEARRESMDAVFADLSDADVARDDLIMAWDFTVRSTEDATGRLVSMRDDAFGDLGDEAPEFVVDPADPAGASDAASGSRVVTGRYTVPNYLTGDGGPGEVLNNGSGPDGTPERNGEREARFICVVPADATAAQGAVLFGHGLLGGAEEVRSVGDLAVPLLGVTVCGTDWVGMASEDVSSILGMLDDFSDFRIVPDRLQQAHLQFLYLGRLLAHPDGLASDPAFALQGGGPVLDGSVVFVGASQGGVLGGATSAVADDWDRAALIVPAQDYSLLLDRSVNFDQFAVAMAASYENPVERQLLLSLAQQLWDRGENSGYSQNLTSDPLPDSDATDVLLLASFGDHQVANIGTDMLARTAGIPLRTPGLAEGRSPDREPFWGIEAVDAWPTDGSLYVMWDFAAPPPPTANVAPREGEDPHGAASSDSQALLAVVSFITGDQVNDPCAADAPCSTPAG